MFNRFALLRAFLVALIGACNSEILWGNMHPPAFFVDVGVWLVYVPMLVFIDLFVRLRHYGYVRVWLIGLLFGIVVEAGMVGMVAEGFGIMVMVMSWHACLTVTLTIMIADLLVPRTLLPDTISRPGKLALGLTALAGLVMMVSMFAAFGLQAILARPFDFLLCLLVAAVVGTVLYLRRFRREVPHPSMWVILGLAGLGFYLGLHLIEIENTDPLKQPYTLLDHQIRAAAYGLLGLIVLSKVVWQRRAVKYSRRGFNLIESAIVLGVTGLVIGGIWVAAASLNQSLKVSRTTSALLVAVSRLRDVVPGSTATGPYVGFEYTFLIGANIFPDDFVSGGATLTPWGTNIVAGVTGAGSTAYLQLIVEVPDKTTCLQMTSSLTGRFKDQDDLAYVIVGPPYTTFSTWPLFVNGTHCNGVSFPTYLSFMFTFGRVN